MFAFLRTVASLYTESLFLPAQFATIQDVFELGHLLIHAIAIVGTSSTQPVFEVLLLFVSCVLFVPSSALSLLNTHPGTGC